MPHKELSINSLKQAFLSAVSLAVLLLAFPSACLSEETVVLNGSVEKTVPSGTSVKLKITSLPMAKGSYLENWDLNGDFIPPKEGDDIVSELVDPIYIQGDLVIPKHTKFFGKVSKVLAPKHFGKDGKIEVSFHGLQTPRGKYLQFTQAQKTISSEPSKKQQIIHGAARAGTYAVGGAAAGALMATQVAGTLLTVAKPEYILASGAGVGLLVGLVASVVKRGQPGRLSPGDEIQINLEQSVVLPVAEPISEQAPENFAVPGLQVVIQKKKLVKDELGKAILVLDLEVSNGTNRTLFGNDFFLLGPYNRMIYPGGLSLEIMDKNTDLLDSFSLKQIKPGSVTKSQIAFEIDFPGFEHILFLRERISQSPVYKATVGYPSNYQPVSKLSGFKRKIFGDNSDPWK